MNTLILGARQHAEVIVDTLLNGTESYNIVGFLDDDEKLQNHKIMRIPVLGKLSDFDKIVIKHNINSVFIGISARHIKVRQNMQEIIHLKKLFNGNAIHSTAYISNKAKIGNGNFFAPTTVINSFAKIGDNCVFYSGAIVDHHTTLGNNIYCGPNVAMAADINIGDNTYIGIGASIIPHISIGTNVTIGAGTVIIKNVPDNAIVVGIPGKVIKYNE